MDTTDRTSPIGTNIHPWVVPNILNEELTFVLTFDYNGDPLVYLGAVVVEFPLLTPLLLSLTI